VAQITVVILASAVVLALAVGVRALRVWHSAIVLATSAVAVAAVAWFTQAHISQWDELRAPLLLVLLIVTVHFGITLWLRVRLRRAAAMATDCPRCHYALPRNTDGTLASAHPLACPECGTIAADWMAIVREKSARRVWLYRCAVHALLGGLVFSMLALFVVPLRRQLSEMPYGEIFLADNSVQLGNTADGSASFTASTGMFIYRANFLHVLGSEQERVIIVGVGSSGLSSRSWGMAVLMNGAPPTNARDLVARALSKCAYDPTLAGAVLDAAIIAAGATNDGERITLAPLQVRKWYLDFEWPTEPAIAPELSIGMPWARWILALLALAGAWAAQPGRFTNPAQPHRPRRSPAQPARRSTGDSSD